MNGTWAAYFLLGVAAHVYYWKLPIELESWRFWADVSVWPYIMLWDWPSAAAHLPPDVLHGSGYLFGLGFIYILVTTL